MNVEVSPSRSTGRRWAKTEETRRQLLDAAREVFIEQGYDASGVTDVVARSGSSVGSVYHHFGGKAELYLALWERYVDRLADSAAAAVAAARADVDLSPHEQFEAGAMAYLAAVWEDREVMPVFYTGDGPPGFEMLRRERNADWIRRNLRVLGLGVGVEDRLLGGVLTALMGEAARMTVSCETQQDADRVARHAMVLVRRVTGGAAGATDH